MKMKTKMGFLVVVVSTKNSKPKQVVSGPMLITYREERNKEKQREEREEKNDG